MRRLLAVAVTILATCSLFAMPANAGTLTSASFTANGTGYAVTNATNSRYDWRYTTATTGVVSRVEATIPSGTRPTNAKYLSLNSVSTAGNYASSPDSPSNSVTGDIDLRVKATFPSWSSANGTGQYDILIDKASSPTNREYELFISNSGSLSLATSPDGGTTWLNNAVGIQSLVTAGQPIWLRATRVVNNGAGGYTTNFYSSSDGSNWTLLNSQTYGGTTSIFDGTNALQIGTEYNGVGVLSTHRGKIYYASVSAGISGTTSSPSTCTTSGVIACFNATDYISGASFASSSTAHETWTVNRTGTNLPADIAGDLAISEVSGSPTGGSASYRLIDNKAVYLPPPATSYSSTYAVLLALTGFTNTATAGAYTSTITTFDNQATPVAVDSVTTGTLSFADLNSSAVVGTTVDPTFSFTVASHSGACNSVAQTATSTGAAVALGRVTSASGSVSAQDLSVGTNANTGFSLQLRTSGALTNGSNTIANAPGTNASPAAFPATTTAAFGYTVSGLSRFTSAWAGPETTNREVMNGATVGTVTNCIAYKVQVTASTPAGSYSTTAYYTAIPTF